MAIHPTFAQEAIYAAQRLESSGVSLKVAATSPLAQICACVAPTALTTQSRKPNYIADPQLLVWQAGCTARDGYEDEHAMGVEAYAEFLSRQMSNYLAFMQNVVAPMIGAISNSIEKHFKELKPKLNILQDVKAVGLPSPLRQESFAKKVRSDVPASASPFKTATFFMKRLNQDEIIALMKKAFPGADKEIDEWVVQMDPAQLQTTWDNLFDVSRQPDAFYQSVMDVKGDRVNPALIGYMLSHALRDAPDDEVNVSLGVFNAGLIQLGELCATILADHMLYYSQCVQSERLLLGVQDNCVLVNDQTYEKFKALGLANTMILGAALMDLQTKAPYLNDITANAGNAQRTWDTYVAAANMAANNKLAEAGSQILFDAIDDVVCKDAQSLQNAFGHKGLKENDPPQMHLHAYRERLKDWIRKLPQNYYSAEKASEMAMCVCVDILYTGTAAKEISEGLSDVRQTNPNLNVREAMMLACAEYLGKFFADMITQETLAR